MGDSPELLTAFLAGLRIGAVPVPVSTMLKPKDIAVLARDSRARLVALSAEFAELAPAVGGLPDLADVVVLTDAGTALPEVRGRPGARLGRLRRRRRRPARADGASRTRPSPTPPPSGCTPRAPPARPRAAMHRHGSLRDTAETYAQDVLRHRPGRRHLLGGEVLLRLRPGQHADLPVLGGRQHGPRPLAAQPGRARCGCCASSGRRCSSAGPTYYAALLAAGLPQDAFAERAGLRLGRRGVPGRAVRAVHHDVRRGDARRHRLDGDAAHLHQRPAGPHPGRGDRRDRRRLRGQDRRRRRRTRCPTARPATCSCAGSSAATGYWCRMETTRLVFQGDWVRTGDTYVRSADGYYSSLGRTDDIIKAGGIWVSPTEVEERLRQHPEVDPGRRRLGARRDRAWTSRWRASCCPRRDGHGPDDLVAFCREGLAAFKRPRNVLVFDELPHDGHRQAAALPRPRTGPRAARRLGRPPRPGPDHRRTRMTATDTLRARRHRGRRARRRGRPARRRRRAGRALRRLLRRLPRAAHGARRQPARGRAAR